MRGFEIKLEKKKSKVQCGHAGLWLAQLSNKLSVKRPHYVNKSSEANCAVLQTLKNLSLLLTVFSEIHFLVQNSKNTTGLMYEMHAGLNKQQRSNRYR